MATSAGKTQRVKGAVARARQPALDRFYARKMPPVTPGEFEFGLTLLRGRGASTIDLTPVTTSFEWNDEEASMNANLQLRRPDPNTWESLPIGRGHQVRCRVKWAGRWYELWTMRVQSPEPETETGELSVGLTDDMDIVKRGRQRWLYRKTKRRRHGWFGHDVLRDAARKEGIKLGAIAKCTKRQSKFDVTGSFLDLAVAVYSHERDVTGRKFVLRMRDGKFEAIPYKRNRTIYRIGEALKSAAPKEVPKVQNPATVWTGRGRVGRGKAAKKVSHTEYRRDMVRRFGYSHKRKDYGQVDSLADLKAKVRADLARHYTVEATLTVEFPGIPFIRRGDGVQIVLPQDRFVGDDSFVYATGLRHQVQGESYTTSADFTRTDPFRKYRDDRERAARERARRAREKRRRKT